MKKTLLHLGLFLSMVVGSNLWGETITKNDVIKIVEKATSFAKANGKDKAIAAFNDTSNKDFYTKGGAVYVFAYTMEGVNLALPSKKGLAGKNLLNMLDVDGVPIVKDFIKTCKDGNKGWTKYRFNNPKTNKVEKKLAYVVGMGDWLLGSGIYESDCPECFK